MADPKTTDETDTVLALFRCVDLKYPDGQLLEAFLRESIDPLQTARYILGRCSGDGDALDLDTLLSDWKRLITVCNNDKELHELLGIFIGPSLLDWLLLKAPSLSPEQNHWLVRRSAAAAIAQGFFQFIFGSGLKYTVFTSGIGGPTLPSIIKKVPMRRTAHFTDCVASHVDNPDSSALDVLSRIANPIRWTGIAQEVACKRPRTVSNGLTTSLWRFLSERVATAVAVAWRLVPAPIRIRAYQGLDVLGAHMYGPSRSFKVQRLPFGLYLKTTLAMRHGSLANEFAALQLVRRHTNVPVPSALDLVSDSKKSYLLTTKVCGIPLGWCIDTLSHDEVTTLVGDVEKCLSGLRAIPKEVSPKYAITNALGKACYDGRLITGSNYDEARGDFFGPFVDEDDFNNTLQFVALPNAIHRSGHGIVFTHGDLNMRNIMMHNGRLSGFVDWEICGWYPDYWDYTKAHFTTKLHRR
ncbi:hypothetical protein E4U09_001188 [Claviceps aff. purpurea]|uniref:Aminoglycoside phosphotransferase domain-containing protein n=1 Tax=Claviceps aff. purpurea TaxID=1967640 RepID=A0A9P7U2G9_9HYPO|nr:hypothetical protein E4U09_001188 [Claviceps aff. purpurea]